MAKSNQALHKIKRIAFFNHSMAMGGIEKLLVSMSSELLKQNYEVYMFVFKGGGDLEQALKKVGVIVVDLEKKEGLDFRMVMRIIKNIKHYKIDLVHTNNFMSSLYMLIPALLFSKVKFVHTDHSLVYGQKNRRYKMLKLCSSLYDHFIAVSDQLKLLISDQCGIDKQKIEVIDNGVDTQKFTLDDDVKQKIRKELNINEDVFVLGTVSRLVPVKDHLMLLNAVKQVVEQGYSLNLIIIGDGPERDSIQSKVTEYGLDKIVHLLGEKEEVVSYLQALDAYSLSSISEGMSISLLEAMSCSLPALVTKTGGNIDLVKNDENGLLVDVGDFQAFAKAIITLINDKEKSVRLGVQSRNIVVEHYSLKRMVTRYIALYNS